MKKLIFSLLIVFGSLSFAQIQSFDSTYIEGLRKDVWGTYREIVNQNLNLTDDQSKIFWPLFDEYVAARNPIMDERVSITEEYMMNYYAMDDENAKDLLNRTIQLNQDLLDIRKQSLNKMLAQLPAPLVGKFFQIDARISALVDLIRMSSTPLVRDEE